MTSKIGIGTEQGWREAGERRNFPEKTGDLRTPNLGELVQDRPANIPRFFWGFLGALDPLDGVRNVVLGESDWGTAAASPAELETDGLGRVWGGCPHPDWKWRNPSCAFRGSPP